MGETKNLLIGSGFSLFRLTRLHRLAAPLTRGLGAILMFHRVRPAEPEAFAPNRFLEITPEFLDGVLTRLKATGFHILSLDAALARLAKTQFVKPDEEEPPFAVLTFDDGMRDVQEFALPILARHQAPFTLYVTTGFADRSVAPSWIALEDSIRRLSKIAVTIDGTPVTLRTATAEDKTTAYQTLFQKLSAGPEAAMSNVIGQLMAEAGIDAASLVESLCLNWAELAALAQDPLCTISVHTLTHARLAKHDEATVRRELFESRRLIEAHIGKDARHLAYPVGDATSAGPREFAIAKDLGFASAVTTQPGMIFPGHKDALMALPRLSINGNWQSLDAVEILLSGAPFALWNLAKKVA